MSQPPSAPPARRFSRRKFLGLSALTGVGSIAGVSAYAHLLEPEQLSITEKDIQLPNLPDDLDGIRIAQMTDFHYKPEDHKVLADAVASINQITPDIIFLTGDYVDEPSNLAELVSHFEKLHAPYGIYACIGNHDHWKGAPRVLGKALRSVGVRILVNEGTVRRIRDTPVYILATDSIWAGKPDLDKCYANHNGEPVIALVHEPDYFDEFTSKYPLDLQLSGHTHGGQCRIPLVDVAPFSVPYGRNYVYGEFPHPTQQNARLFVSRGLGTTAIRVRFACPPELAVLTLRKS